VTEERASALPDDVSLRAAAVRVFADQLVADGMPREDLDAIMRSEDALEQLMRRLLQPGPRLTMDDVLARTGLTREQVDRIRRAGGITILLDEEPEFTEADVETFQLFTMAASLFGEAALLGFVRVAASSLARIAEAAVALFGTRVERELAAQNASPEVQAKAELQATQLLAATGSVLDPTFRIHAGIAIDRMVRAREGTSSFETGHLAVGFVDLVGFTPFSEQLSATLLAEVIDEFEGFAFDVVTDQDARIVKLIGDAVMFVALDVDAACEIALQLTEHFRGDSPVTPRGGLAVGEMLIRAGDYYGPIVNLASRASELAVPYEILVTRRMVDAAGAAYRFDPAGRRALKGFSEPVELASLSRAPLPEQM
jgi:adenylate cyclase